MALDAASGVERPLIRLTNTYTGFAGISPDGRLVAYTTGDNGEEADDHTVSTEGGRPRAVHTLAHPKMLTGDLLSIEWTRDSQRLVFTQTEASASSTWGSAAGWASSDSDRSGHLESELNALRIHPDGRRLAFVAGESRFAVWTLENFLTARPPSKPTVLTTQRVIAEGAPGIASRLTVVISYTWTTTQEISRRSNTRMNRREGSRPTVFRDQDEGFPLASAFSREASLSLTSAREGESQRVASGVR